MSLDRLLRENREAKEYFDSLSPQIRDFLYRQGEEINSHGALLETAREFMGAGGTGEFPLDNELTSEWVRVHET